MEVRDTIQEMINELVDAIPDAEKFDSGTKPQELELES